MHFRVVDGAPIRQEQASQEAVTLVCSETARRVASLLPHDLEFIRAVVLQR